MPAIQLEIQRTLDLEAFERGDTLWIYRCFARLRFKKSSGWSDERFAILDTGAPFSIIPVTVWETLIIKELSPAHLQGVIPKATAILPAQLAQVSCVLVDKENISPPLGIVALLVDVPDVPLILGWSGCLDKAKLTVDGPRHKAQLEF